MKYTYIILLSILFSGCNQSKKETLKPIIKQQVNIVKIPILNLEEANRLSKLPLGCIEIEYPNKLNQVVASSNDLKSPKELHPAFYGCFDWHSSVHGHWSLVSLLKQFPNLENSELIKAKLLKRISKENILMEILYFDEKQNSSFERTYGWAWILKLAEELHTWDNETARTLENNLQPLTDLIIEKYISFLPKLNYPIRVGEHTNTAFGLSFAYDYAKTVKHQELINLIEKRAQEFYMDDKNCPISWEPSGFDFLSPCLEEAAIMKRILPKGKFSRWIANFLPQLKNTTFNLEVGKVSDRTDGKLVHLDGANFSRAWSLYKIAEDLPEYNHLKNIANTHINHSLPNIVDANYEGGHWLGSFAIYALNSTNKK